MRGSAHFQKWIVALLCFGLSGCASHEVTHAREERSPRVQTAPVWDDCELPAPKTEAAGPEAAGAGEVGEGMSKPGLRIVVFSLGQADSMLILSDPKGSHAKSMLVDLGEPLNSTGVVNNDHNYVVVASKLAQLLPRKKLDYFLLSHFHADHTGSSQTGIFGLINDEHYKVGTFIRPGSDEDAHFGAAARGTYHKIKDALSKWKSNGSVTTEEVAAVGHHYHLGDVDIEIVAAGGKVRAGDAGTLDEIVAKHGDVYSNIGPPSENDLSIAMLVKYGQFELFSAGDLTGASDEGGGEDVDYTERSFGGENAQVYSNVEKRLVAAWHNDVEVYRANHHGSEFSSTPRLIQALDPEFVIYSCGGMYKHPSHEVVKRVATTARQLVTSRLDTSAWDEDDFESDRGQVEGRDITIEVGDGGLWYSINRELHRAYNDVQEDGDTFSPGGSGQDVGEEDKQWIP